MRTHCTGCQLCVSVCPNQVLRPSTKLETLIQPEMSYERGYCRPECTKCSEVCGKSENQSFWEHLDVLRASLVKIAIVTVAFGVVAFFFKDELFAVILAPKRQILLLTGFYFRLVDG